MDVDDVDIIWRAVQGVLVLFTVGAAGYLIAKAGWVNKDTKNLFAKLVMQVALPPYMLYNISSFMNRDDLLHFGYGLLVPAVSIALTFSIALLLAKTLKVSRERRGVFCCGFVNSSTIFMGLPVNLALFGEASIPYVLMYYFVNALFFWTVGNYMVAASGGKVDGVAPKVSLLSWKTLKQIISPPTLGMVVGVILLLLNVQLPVFIKVSARYLGSMTTPLALMIVGITLHEVNISKISISRDLLIVLLGRFVVSPLSIVVICWFIPLSDLMRNVFIIQASLPVIVNLSLLSSYYKSDTEFAAVAISASTLCSVVTIPVFMLMMY
jgi:predicted permease